MRHIVLFIMVCLFTGEVRGTSVEDYYPLKHGDYHNFQEEGGSATVTEQVSTSSKYGGQFKISISMSDEPALDMDLFVGFSDDDLYYYGIDQIYTYNDYEDFDDYGPVYVYNMEVQVDFSSPVKILEGDLLSGAGGSFNSSFSGTATMTMSTRELGSMSFPSDVSGTISGSIEPIHVVEAMSGVFLNCRKVSYDMPVTIHELGETQDFGETIYLAPGVGTVCGEDDDEDQFETFRYPLTSGIAGGKTISPIDVYTLTVISGDGDGTLYTNGQQVVITADAPSAGRVFDCWTGATQYVASVSNFSTVVTMLGENVAVTATYKDLPQVTVTAGEGGSITPDSKQIVDFGGSLELTATPNVGCKFKHWLVNGEIMAVGQEELT
nr:hypothetical protein [Kiritimatiellota bacterium]